MATISEIFNNIQNNIREELRINPLFHTPYNYPTYPIDLEEERSDVWDNERLYIVGNSL